MENVIAPVRILLVEDNPHDVEITQRALAKGRIRNEMVVASDGQEALEALRGGEDNTLPVLILLDLNLPRVDGLTVLREIKSEPRLRSIPVIVLTASSRDEDIVRSYDLGVNTFITKPVEFEEFVKVVAAIETYWLYVATLPSAVKA
jgi:CheY-like chemotaxis protein